MYRRWTNEEENQLITLLQEGNHLNDIPPRLLRARGDPMRSRLSLIQRMAKLHDGGRIDVNQGGGHPREQERDRLLRIFLGWF